MFRTYKYLLNNYLQAEMKGKMIATEEEQPEPMERQSSLGIKIIDIDAVQKKAKEGIDNTDDKVKSFDQEDDEEGGKRKKGLSLVLRSPYKQRALEILTPITDEQNAVYDYCISRLLDR